GERPAIARPRTAVTRPAVSAERPALEPQPAPDRKWMLVGVVSTALVALLAAAAVVVARRSPDWITARVFPLATLRSGSPSAVVPPAKKVQRSEAARVEPPAGTVAAAATAPSAAISDPAPTRTPATAIETAAAAAAPTATPSADASPSDDGSAALARGVRLYETGRQREAIRVLEGLTREHPMVVSGWVYLGMAKFDRNDRTGAQRAAKKALELDPKNGRALMLLATVHLEAGDTQRARTHLRRYLELYPNGQFAREARQLLGRR
ncbi:MAG TPA: tetratricopeptide repeat protein, partial [Myxococcaceae bacterium]|nr:tetratricopeptide repeat protein [Myxococcaceae bacterium]